MIRCPSKTIDPAGGNLPPAGSWSLHHRLQARGSVTSSDFAVTTVERLSGSCRRTSSSVADHCSNTSRSEPLGRDSSWYKEPPRCSLANGRRSNKPRRCPESNTTNDRRFSCIANRYRIRDHCRRTDVRHGRPPLWASLRSTGALPWAGVRTSERTLVRDLARRAPGRLCPRERRLHGPHSCAPPPPPRMPLGERMSACEEQESHSSTEPRALNDPLHKHVLHNRRSHRYNRQCDRPPRCRVNIR